MSTGLSPELAAAEVLARAEVTNPPVDPFALARLWPGLRVTLTDLDGPGYLLNLDGRIGELVVRVSDPPRRRRYTVAHELGHWVLARNGEVFEQQPTRTTVERWCDKFAAALLMPSGWVVKALITSLLRIDAIAGLRHRFDVSYQAALLRVSEVSPIEIGIASIDPEGLRLEWTTARGGIGRFNWIDRVWLARRLPDVRVQAKWSGERLELQALRLRPGKWLVAVASTRATRQWRESARLQQHLASAREPDFIGVLPESVTARLDHFSTSSRRLPTGSALSITPRPATSPRPDRGLDR